MSDLRTVDPAQKRIVSVLSAVQVIGGIGNGAGLAVGALLVKDVSGSSGWSGMAVVMLTRYVTSRAPCARPAGTASASATVARTTTIAITRVRTDAMLRIPTRR